METGMTLNPWVVTLCFILFGLMSISTMIAMVKQRKMGLAGLMFVSVVVCIASAYISSTVSPSG